MADTDLEKRLWLLEKETKALEKKIDFLTKAILTLKVDIKDFLSIQKTYTELMFNGSKKDDVSYVIDQNDERTAI